MKKLTIALACLAFSTTAFSQNVVPPSGPVGFGTSSPNAQLEINAEAPTNDPNNTPEALFLRTTRPVTTQNYYGNPGTAFRIQRTDMLSISPTVGQLQNGTEVDVFTISGNGYAQGKAFTADYLKSESTNASVFVYPDKISWGVTGNFSQHNFMSFAGDGKVGFGTTNIAGGSHRVYVKGSLLAEEVVVKLEAAWPDFVFAKDYELMSLTDLEAFIQTNSHLPNIPSQAEVREDGLEVGETQRLMMQKIEELTLYVIDLNKALEATKEELEALKTK